jgi:DNA-binding MarR family transcriptional regulator
MAANGHLRMRNAAPGPKGGGLYLSELQRTRLLDAAFAMNPLMATIVLPYRGRAGAARELARPISQAGPTLPTLPHLPEGSNPPNHRGLNRSRARSIPRSGFIGRDETSGSRADFRLTVRTQTVLAVVAEHPGLNNHRVSELAGISDQGQISRLMMRLQELGLLEDTRADERGVRKAWRLTPHGEEILRANRPLKERAA